MRKQEGLIRAIPDVDSVKGRRNDDKRLSLPDCQYESRRWFDYREMSLYSYNRYDNRHMVNESSIYVINNN